MLLALGTSLSRNPGAATLRNALADCMVRVVDRLDTVKVRRVVTHLHIYVIPHSPSLFTSDDCGRLSALRLSLGLLTLVVATFVPVTSIPFSLCSPG